MDIDAIDRKVRELMAWKAEVSPMLEAAKAGWDEHQEHLAKDDKDDAARAARTNVPSGKNLPQAAAPEGQESAPAEAGPSAAPDPGADHEPAAKAGEAVSG